MQAKAVFLLDNFMRRKRLTHASAGSAWLRDNNINTQHHVVPVPGNAAELTGPARDVHAWLTDEHARTGQPVPVKAVIEAKGTFHRLLECQVLIGRPLEELLDASLLYVEEDRRPETEGEEDAD